jgi:hypothetical protein
MSNRVVMRREKKVLFIRDDGIEKNKKELLE